jgi:hypothetical protein
MRAATTTPGSKLGNPYPPTVKHQFATPGFIAVDILFTLAGHKKPYPKPEPELTETEPELSKTSVFG